MTRTTATIEVDKTYWCNSTNEEVKTVKYDGDGMWVVKGKKSAYMVHASSLVLIMSPGDILELEA